MNFKCVLLLPIIASIFFLAGCNSNFRSGPTVNWEGKVTINGQSLPEGSDGRIIIQSSCVKGQAGSITAVISNGSYKAQNVPKGSVTVRFCVLIPDGIPSQADKERGIYPKKNIVPREWQVGKPYNADKSESSKDFNLEGKL